MNKKFWGLVHRSSFIVHRFEAVAQSAQIVFAHESFENLWPREKPETFAEKSAATKTMQLGFIGERSRLQFLHSEKIGKLRMLAVEDRTRFADVVLPPRERVDAHPVVVACDCSGVVVDPQALPLQPVRKFDVFPCG